MLFFVNIMDFNSNSSSDWTINIIQSEHSLHILSEMIWSIDRPILLAPYLLIVQSEELLLLKSIIFTKNSMVHNV
jgi:hypothetical protein